MGVDKELLADIAEANEARVGFLKAYKVPVPLDLMYVTSLLEFILTEDLDEARLYHERRIAPILEGQVAHLQQLIAEAQEQIEAQAEAQARAEREAVLLGRA